MKAVRPYTIKGKILCAILRSLCFFIYIFKGRSWSVPLEFEENPRTMSVSELIYFTYKYYYDPPVKPSDPSIVDHFKKNKGVEPQFDVLVTVSIGGDLMPYELIKPADTQHLWDEVGKDFFGSDIVFANLETPLDQHRKPGFVPEVMLNHMHFNTDAATMEIFAGNKAFKGYDVLSIANNHSLDMGETGLLNTMEWLDLQGIKSVGAKKKQSDADFEIIESHGIKIGFMAYTYSLNEYLPAKGKEWMLNYLPLNCEDCDIELIRAHAKACRDAGADIIICSLHCGNAYQAYPSRQTIELYQQVFASSGVDIIAGGHPHNLQPWQTYPFTDPFSGQLKNGFAIYSLADFIAYDIFTWCHLCAYLKLELGRDQEGKVIFNVKVKPMIMQREQDQLKLVYAENVLNKSNLSDEMKDIKQLFDICTQ